MAKHLIEIKSGGDVLNYGKPKPDFQYGIQKTNLILEEDLYGDYIRVWNIGEMVINLNNWTIRQQDVDESSGIEFKFREDKLRIHGTSCCLNHGQSFTIWSSRSDGSNSPSAFIMPNFDWSVGDRTTTLLDASNSEVYEVITSGSDQEQRPGSNRTTLPNYGEVVIPASQVGLIVGSINRLQEMSGTRMEGVERSGSGDFLVRIYGDQQGIDHGLQLVYDLLDKKEITVTARTSQVRVEIIIPGHKTGFIFDDEGEIIKQLQESSRTRMVVVEGSLQVQDQNGKKLRIYGDPLKVENAKQLIYNLIAEELATDVPSSPSRKRTRSSDAIGDF